MDRHDPEGMAIELDLDESVAAELDGQVLRRREFENALQEVLVR